MKKVLIGMFIIFSCVLITGCGKYGADNLIKEYSKKINDINTYKLSGILEIINNDDIYSYDVDVSYKKENNFKVSLKNKINNYEQIILRNNDGIYVLTPALNKNFKFQSEWPFNSSQSYLLQTLLKDMENEKEIKFETVDNGYIIETKANYSSNKDLITQKIYFDKDKNINKVEVLDENNIVKMKMNINNIEYNTTFDDNYFDLKQSTNSNIEKENLEKTMKEIIYPMYIPQNTYLSSEDKISKENGERIIMTFSGDNPFTLIQETVNMPSSFNLIPIEGEPYLLSNSIATVTQNSIEWINNGVEYYLTSEELSQDDLISVAKSLSPMAITK